MEYFFECKSRVNSRSASWKGRLRIIKRGDPCEADVQARGSSFHILLGSHMYGNYICVPEWNIGTGLSYYEDVFWNEEHLRSLGNVKKADAVSLACAIKCIGEKNF